MADDPGTRVAMTPVVPPAALAWATFPVAGAGPVHVALAAGLWTAAPAWGAGMVAVADAQPLWALLSLTAARPVPARVAAAAS